MTRKPRLWPPILIFFALMAGITLFTPWKRLDWMLFDHLARSETPQLVDEIVPIAVPLDGDTAANRARLAELLRLLASGSLGRPRIALLDVQVRPEASGLAALTAAIQALQAAGTAVYAAVNPLDPLAAGAMQRDFMNEHAADLYNNVLDGFGHTLIQRLTDTAKYDPYLDLGDGTLIPALPIKVAEDFFHRPIDSPIRPIILYMGQHGEFLRQAYRYDAGGLTALDAGAGQPQLKDKVVVIGALGSGPTPSGLEIMAWALSARISTGDNRNVAELLAEPWLLLTLVVVSPALTCLVAWLLLLRFPKLRSGRIWLAPVAGAAVAVLVMLAFVGLLLKLQHAYPQITLQTLGTLLAAGLAFDYLRRHLNWAAQTGEKLAGAVDIDVFVSYSRTHEEHCAWVEANIVETLRQRVRRADGRPATVFFDKESIRPGDFWQERVARDVNACRVFVPVYSDDYFQKAVCSFEIRQALKQQMTGRGHIVPVYRSGGDVPPPYDDINYINAARDPAFDDKLVAEVTRLLALGEARAAAGLADAEARA